LPMKLGPISGPEEQYLPLLRLQQLSSTPLLLQWGLMGNRDHAEGFDGWSAPMIYNELCK
jgi:hypothetical protein